ncbi:MAG: NAD-dependent epimerase/dehydratase family protein [Flavobacteriaceae bacterium]
MILVTGATGLVGAHLCLELLQKNQPVVALYRREKKRQALRHFFQNKAQLSLYEKIEWRKADLCHLPQLTAAFNGITQVYHCAAYISMAYYKRAHLHEVNQQGTAYVVNLCIANKVKKLAYVSSIAALGSDTYSTTIDENTPWNPTRDKTPYAYSKYGAELEVWRASQEGVPVVIVNPGVILGTGMPRTPLEQLVHQINKGLRFYPTGQTGYVAVEDVVETLIRLMDNNHINQRYILVAENWSYKDLTGLVAKRLGKKAPSRALKPFYLYTAWVLESILSRLRLRSQFLSKALVKSLSDQHIIDGSQIKRALTDFDYRSIAPYIKKSLSAF